MAKITDYPSITTIDANTILLADGSSGTGKILASDMAKYALETYAGSTLAGSAQSVKAALTGLAPQVKASITDLSTISPGEQGYFQLNASVSPTGATAYFTIWCTGNNDRRGIIAILTAESKTRFFANAGHASSGVFTWKGWNELAKFDDVYSVSYNGMTKVASEGITDLNVITSPGSYIVTSSGVAATLLNSPITDSGFSIHVESVAGGTGQYIVQTVKRVLSARNVAQIFTRIYTGAAWGAWVENPSRAEVDALNSKFDGNNIQFVNMSGSSGNANNAIRFRGTSESDTAEHEYVMFGIGSGNRMFGFYAYIRYSSQTITVYSFGDIQCTGSISGGTAIIKVATWMKSFGIVRNKVASIDYTSVS